jgi:hypothetical protein
VRANPAPKQFRILVVTGNHEQGETFCSQLRNECPNFDINPDTIWSLSDNEINQATFISQVAARSKEKQAHLVIIDENLIEHQRTFYRDLQKALLPAHCLFLVSHEIKTHRVIDNVLTGIIPINIRNDSPNAILTDLSLDFAHYQQNMKGRKK